MNVNQLSKLPLPVWYGIAAIAGIGVAYWLAKSSVKAVGEAAGKVVDHVATGLDNGAADVTSSNNLIYRGVNQAGHWFFGLDKGTTIGTAIYDLFHDDPPLNPPGSRKRGDVWYGYDIEKSNADVQAAANSQIAKDIKQYGGGYGALTK